MSGTSQQLSNLQMTSMVGPASQQQQKRAGIRFKMNGAMPGYLALTVAGRRTDILDLMRSKLHEIDDRQSPSCDSSCSYSTNIPSFNLYPILCRLRHCHLIIFNIIITQYQFLLLLLRQRQTIRCSSPSHH